MIQIIWPLGVNLISAQFSFRKDFYSVKFFSPSLFLLSVLSFTPFSQIPFRPYVISVYVWNES